MRNWSATAVVVLSLGMSANSVPAHQGVEFERDGTGRNPVDILARHADDAAEAVNAYLLAYLKS
jgi:hypothetical protein